MKIYHLAASILILSGCLLFSCTEKTGGESHTIQVEAAMAAPVNLKASDYFTDITYIPLETSEECLIDANPQVRVFNDYLIVLSRNNCYLFDKLSGRFIRQIGHHGDDPGGYNSVNFIPDAENNRLLFPGWRKDLLAYSLQGDFLGSIPVPKSGDIFASISNQVVLPDNNMAMYLSDSYGGEKNKLFFYSAQGDSLRSLPAIDPLAPLEIGNIHMWRGEKGVQQFGLAAYNGLMILEGKQGERHNMISLGHPCFWKREEGIFMKELFNDTIYKLQDYELHPHYIFNLGKYEWPYLKRFENNSLGRIFLSSVMEGNDILLFNFVLDCYSNENKRVYNGVYRKSTGETSVSLYEKGFYDDISHFMLLQPMTVSSRGEFASIIPAYRISNWFEDYPDKVQALPDGVKLLSGIGEEDNPVVVLYR